MPIHSERRRALRHAFAASIELVHKESNNRAAARIKDLSLFGCFVETATLFADGAEVRLRISYGGMSLAALGKVIYSRANSGMGIAFTTIEPSSLPVLQMWLAELKK